MKKHIKTIIIIVLILIISIMGKNLFFIGDAIERDKIVQATVWQLTEEGYTKDDIRNIRSSYNPLKGGMFPYKAYVQFKNNSSKIKIYSWDDSSKSSAHESGYTCSDIFSE